MTAKLKFTHSANPTSEHTTLDMRIALETAGEYQADNPHHQRIVSLHWQRTNSEPDHWYAFAIDIDTDSAENLEHCTKIVRKLKGKDALHLDTHTQPKDVLERLETLRATECVYDARLSEWVPIADAMPAEYKAWRDAHKTGCTVGCLARDEREAKANIMAEFAKFAAASTYGAYDDELANWILADKPVRQVPHYISKSPDLTPFVDRIAA